MLFPAEIQEIKTDPRCSEGFGQRGLDRPGAIKTDVVTEIPSTLSLS